MDYPRTIIEFALAGFLYSQAKAHLWMHSFIVSCVCVYVVVVAGMPDSHVRAIRPPVNDSDVLQQSNARA